MHFADSVYQERQMPVTVEQPCFDPGDMGCEPLAMPEGNELVLPAVQQHGNGDIGQLESPRADVAAGVVPPSWLPGASPL